MSLTLPYEQILITQTALDYCIFFYLNNNTILAIGYCDLQYICFLYLCPYNSPSMHLVLGCVYLYTYRFAQCPSSCHTMYIYFELYQGLLYHSHNQGASVSDLKIPSGLGEIPCIPFDLGLFFKISLSSGEICELLYDFEETPQTFTKLFEISHKSESFIQVSIHDQLLVSIVPVSYEY